MERYKNLDEKTKGLGILELLIGLLILIFVIIGFMKGATDFMLYLKADKINSRAKELAEQLKSEILNRPYSEISNCFISSITGELQFNSTNNETNITFDTPSFYVKNCTGVNKCTAQFGCIYCYVGEEVILNTDQNCTVGYPIRVGYNAGRIIYTDEETGEKRETGIGVGIKVYYTEPKTKREKEINMLIFKKIE